MAGRKIKRSKQFFASSAQNDISATTLGPGGKLKINAYGGPSLIDMKTMVLSGNMAKGAST